MSQVPSPQFDDYAHSETGSPPPPQKKTLLSPEMALEELFYVIRSFKLLFRRFLCFIGVRVKILISDCGFISSFYFLTRSNLTVESV